MSTLKLDLRTKSHLLGGILSAEVRDSKLSLVGHLGRGQPLAVEPGMYQVNAVLEDGRRHSRLIQVAAGEEREIAFESMEGAPEAVSAGASIELSELDSIAPSADRANSRALHPRTSVDRGPLPILMHVEGAQLTAVGPQRWDVRGDAGRLARAQFQLGSETVTISLPTLGAGDSRPDCFVQAEPRAGRYALRALIHSWRAVASTLQHMLLQGQVSSAVNVASQATDLLASKYSDPIGAALGALLLHRLGRLEPLESWLEHLAQRFAWLPDARILRVALKARRERSGGGLDELLSVCTERPLFTESYSILLDLLRRWPADSGKEQRLEALTGLVERHGEIDWDAITLTTRSGAC